MQSDNSRNDICPVGARIVTVVLTAFAFGLEAGADGNSIRMVCLGIFTLVSSVALWLGVVSRSEAIKHKERNAR